MISAPETVRQATNCENLDQVLKFLFKSRFCVASELVVTKPHPAKDSLMSCPFCPNPAGFCEQLLLADFTGEPLPPLFSFPPLKRIPKR